MKHDKEKYEVFRKAVWERDYGIFIPDRKLRKGKDEWKKACMFWKCLTEQEQTVFLYVWKDILWQANTLDVAHYKPKSIKQNDKYNPDAAALVNNIAHSLLDTYHCPLTGVNITKEEKQQWFNRIGERVKQGR